MAAPATNDAMQAQDDEPMENGEEEFVPAFDPLAVTEATRETTFKPERCQPSSMITSPYIPNHRLASKAVVETPQLGMPGSCHAEGSEP